jgi:hypothetical protein
MPEAGSKDEYRAVQAELMRAKARFIRAQTELAKAKTAKIKAETFEHHGISADDEDDERRVLEKRNAHLYAQLEREEAKLAALEGDDDVEKGDEDFEPVRKSRARLVRRVSQVQKQQK